MISLTCTVNMYTRTEPKCSDPQTSAQQHQAASRQPLSGGAEESDQGRKTDERGRAWRRDLAGWRELGLALVDGNAWHGRERGKEGRKGGGGEEEEEEEGRRNIVCIGM